MALSSLVDWRDFEQFVRDMYAADCSVVAERDVTLVGSSGAKRQIDVRVMQTKGQHTHVTVIECKRWKDPVSRDRIDVLAATIKAIGAHKGVMFTTTAYEEGAKLEAAAEGIDLFLVRDLTEDDWGKPGRIVRMYMHYISASLEAPIFPEARWMGMGDPQMNIDFGARGDTSDPSPKLYGPNGKEGPSLRRLVRSLRSSVMSAIGPKVPLLEGGQDGASVVYEVDITGNLAPEFDTRELRCSNGVLTISAVKLHMFVRVLQSKIEVDRAAKFDLAVAIEDLLGIAKSYAGRPVGSSTVEVEPPAVPSNARALENDTIFKAQLDEYEPFEAVDLAKVIKVAPINVNVMPPPAPASP